MQRVFASFTALLIFASPACSTQLSREVIQNHPRIKLTVVEPQVVERSDPFPPPWTRAPERGADSFVAFLGQSSAPSMDAAKQEAMKDLLSAVSNFISVEIESEFLDIATDSSQQIRSVVQTRSGSRVEGIAADSFYWERIAASPLDTSSGNFRYYVHARVPRVEITRARAKKLAERKERGGKRTIVILPFRPVLATPDLRPLANAFAEELGRRLADLPGIHVADASIVGALLDGGKGDSEAEALQAVRDTFLPDLIISGGYQLHEKKLRVTIALHEAGKSEPRIAAPIERPYDKLFDLQDALITMIKTELGAAGAKSERAPEKVDEKSALAAFEAHHEAYALYRQGKNDAALERIDRALALNPNYAEAHFRLGRILERLGRYGFVPPQTVAGTPLDPAILEPMSCVPWSEISTEERTVFMNTVERPADSFTDPKTSPAVLENVDYLFSAMDFLLQGGSQADPGISDRASSAAGAYFHAFREARLRGDLRLENEIVLAFADLLVRLDRLDAAASWYARLDQKTGADDHHLKSLIRFGQGKVARIRAQFPAAELLLFDALGHRAILGEKPYLLEIFNELGALHVEMTNYQKARVHFRRARQMAEELDHPYFRAVLANNIGVLDYLSGDAISAAREFDRAHEYLKDIDEAEGQISTALNVAHSSAGRGDLDRAGAYLAEAQRIVRGTAQESRLATVYEERGRQALERGQKQDALRDLLRSFVIGKRLDRLADLLRNYNGVIAAQYYHLAEEGNFDWVTCLQHETHTLLSRGYGGDGSSLANYYRWYERGRYYYEDIYLEHNYQQSYRRGEPQGLSYLYTLLNAEALARLPR
jgi:tetratricopeptide (TPR) repeat protein